MTESERSEPYHWRLGLSEGEPEKVRQEVKARGWAIIKIKFARKISDGMLWNV